MYRLFDKLKPAFFKAWDQKLLLNRPALWATKFHYALVLGLLGLALSGLTVWLMPIDIAAVPNAWLHLLYAAIPSAVGLAIWIWQVSLFKTDKAFGEAGTSMALRDQKIYALIVIMAIGLPVLHNYRVSEKIRHAIPESVLVEDLNHLNVMAAFTTNYGAYHNEQDVKHSLEERLDYYSFSYYTISNADFEKLKSSDHNRSRFMYLSRPHNKEEALHNLEKYIELVRKYSHAPFEVSAEQIYEAFVDLNDRGDFIELPESYAEDIASVNLEKLQEAKLGETHLLGGKSWKLPLLLFLWSFGLLLIGLQTSGRSLLFSAILGGVLVFAAAVSAEFLRFITAMGGEAWMSLIFLSLMLVFAGILLLGKKTSQKGLIWRQMILSLFVAGLVFVPICSWLLTYEFSEALREWRYALSYSDRNAIYEVLLFGGSAIPLFLWNLGLRQRFIRLHVRPKSR
ncbi:MAG: hypothetical protein AAFN10_03555 [Bacteroidota bacterium]